MCSEPIRFKAGANQVYTNSLHTFNPSQFADSELNIQYVFDKEVFPIVVQCVSLDDGKGAFFINGFCTLVINLKDNKYNFCLK